MIEIRLSPEADPRALVALRSVASVHPGDEEVVVHVSGRTVTLGEKVDGSLTCLNDLACVAESMAVPDEDG